MVERLFSVSGSVGSLDGTRSRTAGRKFGRILNGDADRASKTRGSFPRVVLAVAASAEAHAGGTLRRRCGACYGFAHRVIPLVDVDHAPGDPAGQWATQERNGRAYLTRLERLGQW
jgi:hypothetical protein